MTTLREPRGTRPLDVRLGDYTGLGKRPPAKCILLLMKAPFTAVITIVLLAARLGVSANANAQDRCDEKQNQWFRQADPKTWTALHTLFSKFGDCDDGAISEGFSEDVAQLFLKQWTHLETLNHLIASDRPFRNFVLRHIDASLDEDELNGIAENAKSRCPTWGTQLCHSVESKAQSSLAEFSQRRPKS